jgi:hypothetical protein
MAEGKILRSAAFAKAAELARAALKERGLSDVEIEAELDKKIRSSDRRRLGPL